MTLFSKGNLQSCYYNISNVTLGQVAVLYVQSCNYEKMKKMYHTLIFNSNMHHNDIGCLLNPLNVKRSFQVYMYQNHLAVAPDRLV